jgi:hypothetical protein
LPASWPRLAIGTAVAQTTSMDFDIIGEITDIETIAAGKAIRD